MKLRIINFVIWPPFLSVTIVYKEKGSQMTNDSKFHVLFVNQLKYEICTSK